MFVRTAWLLALVAAQGDTTPSSKPASAPASAPATQPGKTVTIGFLDPNVDAILTELEETGAGVKSLKCKVRYIIDSRLNVADHSERDGLIVYQQAKPHPRFFITFTRLIEGPEDDRQVDDKKEWYRLQDRWLTIAKERAAQITMYEAVAQGQDVDFFDINKAPFPFPFGQKKGPLLREFDITLGSSDAKLPDADHLICVPRNGSHVADEWDRLDYFVDRGLHLPIKIVAVEQGGDNVRTALFPDLRKDAINADVGDKHFADPPEWRKYGEPIKEPLGNERLAP